MLLFYLRNRRNVAQESILRFSYLLAFILLTQNNFYFKSEDIYGNLNMYSKQTSTKEFAYAPPPQALPIKRIKSPKKNKNYLFNHVVEKGRIQSDIEGPEPYTLLFVDIFQASHNKFDLEQLVQKWNNCLMPKGPRLNFNKIIVAYRLKLKYLKT